MGSRYAHRDDLAKAVTLVARGLVSTVVGLVRPLEDVNDVFAELESGSVVGRAVLEVASDPAGFPAGRTASDIVSAG